MSDAATPASLEYQPTAIPAAGVAVDSNPVARPFFVRVIADTFSRWGARAGAVWILVIAAGAVLAPYVASSHPYAMRSADGTLSFPLLRHLQPVDVVLPAVAVAAVALFVRRRTTIVGGFGVMLWVAAVVAAFACWPSIPEYRTASLAPLLGSDARAIGLLVVFGVALAVAVIGIPLAGRWGRRAVIRSVLWLSPLLIVLLVSPVRPPRTVVYERYREDQAAGQIAWAVRAPIPYSPSDRLRDMGDAAFLPPDGDHWMGTEFNGSDVFSRMIHACRIALAIGLISTGIARAIGIVVGGLTGYFVGKVDIIGMRLIEVFEAIPTLFLLITFVAFYGRNLYAMMVIIGLTGWTSTARFVRAEFLTLRDRDYVHAAIAAGLPLRAVLFRHMLPNGLTPVLVTTSFGIASAILYESTLSFLGLGLIDEPSWGQMLNQARGVGTTFIWWIAFFPGLAIFLTVFAYNLIGESVRDALDPRLRRGD